MLIRNPKRILEKAILGMLKRNKLRHQYIENRLHIDTGPQHPHKGQLQQLPAEEMADAADSNMDVDEEDNDAGVTSRTLQDILTGPLPSPPPQRSGDFHFGLNAYTQEIGRTSAAK